MKTTKPILYVVSFITAFGANGQASFELSDDYGEYITNTQFYFDSIEQATGTLKGTGHSEFQRWKNFWQHVNVNDGGIYPSVGHMQSIQQLENSTSMYSTMTGNWTEVGPTTPPSIPSISGWGYRIQGAGRLHFLEFDDVNSRVFCGSPAGGLFYSEDNGATWNPGGTDYLPVIGVSHIQIAKGVNNGHTWFISTGDGEGEWSPSNGIWRTTDKGVSWQDVSQNNALHIGNNFPAPRWALCRKILIHPTNSNILYAAFKHGIYKTTNALDPNPANVTWTKILDNTQVGSHYHDIQFKPGTSGNTIIASGEGIYMSTNAGGTWVELADYFDIGKSLAKREFPVTIRFSTLSPNKLYGAYSGRIFHYNFGDGTVYLPFPYPFSNVHRPQAFAVSPFTQDEVLFGNVAGVKKSANGGGQPYTAMSGQLHDDYHWIEYRSSSEYWIATDGGVYKTTNSGQSWTNLSHGLGIAIYFNMSSSESLPNTIIGGGWDTGPNISTSNPPQFSWAGVYSATTAQQDFVVGDAFESLVDGSDPSNPIYYTTASNSNFAKIENNSITHINVGSNIENRSWNQNLVKAEANEDVLFYAGKKRIGRSINQGISWEAISPHSAPNGGSRLFYDVWNNPSHSSVLYTQRVNFSDPANDPDAFELFVSTNAMDPAASVSWNVITPTLSGFNNNLPIRKAISSVAVDDEDPSKIWVVFPGYDPSSPKVLMRENGMWSDITGTGLTGKSVHSIAHQPGTSDLLYVGTEAGVFYKKAGETQWNLYHGVPHTRVTDMEVNMCSSKIRVSTLGRGIWEAPLIENSEFNTTHLDLFIKDTPEDLGQEPSPGVYTDNGPDIWYRNSDDGLDNMYSESLNYDGSTFWVYVRVRNKSCTPSNGGTLSLYWSRLGTAFSWPANWTGGNNFGNTIGSIPIPDIAAGGSTIVKFQWDMSNYVQVNSTSVMACLLARIENLNSDPITSYSTLYEEVKKNNNLAMKNLAIQSASYFKMNNRIPIMIGDNNNGGIYAISINSKQGNGSGHIYEQAELTLKLDDALWQKWNSGNRVSHNLSVFNEAENTIIIQSDSAYLGGLTYLQGERDTVMVGINFLTEEVTDQDLFNFVINETTGNGNQIGAVHVVIGKDDRFLFNAQAGADQTILAGDSVVLSSNTISEPAEYNWYNSDGDLIYSGTDTTIFPTISEEYRLEIISLVDGFKDYDEVEITVDDQVILGITPNPASSNVNIDYSAVACNSAYLVLYDLNTYTSNNYILSPNSNSINIDLSSFQTGSYHVILICDGQITDTSSLMIL